MRGSRHPRPRRGERLDGERAFGLALGEPLRHRVIRSDAQRAGEQAGFARHGRPQEPLDFRRIRRFHAQPERVRVHAVRVPAAVAGEIDRARLAPHTSDRDALRLHVHGSGQDTQRIAETVD